MAKQENETRYNLTIVDKNGETSQKLNAVESAKEKAEKEAQAAGEQSAVHVDRVKTFVITEAESLEEAATLFPQRALEFLNYGARLAQHNLKQDLMEDPDWSEAATEGAFDLLPHIQSPKERRKMSDRDKAINALLKVARTANPNVTVEMIEQMLAQFSAPAETATA